MISLIAQGDRLQMADPLFRQELAQWIRSTRGLNRDDLAVASQRINVCSARMF